MAFIKRSLFLRLALLILGGAGLVLLALISLNHFDMRRQLLADQRQLYHALADAAAARFDLNLQQVQQVVEEAAILFAHQPRTRLGAVNLLEQMLRRHPELYGSAIALAPQQDTVDAGFRILYSWRATDGISTIDRSNPQQDYQSDWFYLPEQLRRPVWTDPYFDADVQTLMVTYCVPVLVDDQLVAVITGDLSLAGLRQRLGALELGSQGQPMLVSQFGRIILHPRPNWEHRETLHSLIEAAASDRDRASLEQLRNALRQPEGGLRFLQIGNERPAWLYFATANLTGWKIGFIIPEQQILAPVVVLAIKTTLISLAGLLLLLLPAFTIARTITRPLQKLCGCAEQLAGGNFAAPLPTERRSDEIGRLIDAFGQMRVDLQNHIQQLTATTAEKEKIASELAIARDIQHSILPKLFPPFPQRAGLDLYALLESAREVGGDLYDFALLDDDRLYLCIGDVSGKGVPASLFMAVGKTLLKSTMQTLQDPARTLEHVNNELAQGNDSCMFITAFCALFDLRSRELLYANAGHNPPVIIEEGQTRLLEAASCPPLAALEGLSYHNQRLTLADGARLLLYTDGVTEAMNPQQQLFGEARLCQLLQSQPARTAEGCVSSIARAIRQFANGAEQSDDITLLCLSYRDHAAAGETCGHNSQSPTSLLVLTNHLSELPRLVAWLEELHRKLAWPLEVLQQLNLVLEEWLVNVISYAFDDTQLHEIELRLWHRADQIRLEVCDDGRPFDPTAQPEPDLSLPIEQRPIGGLGLHFILNSLDEVRYQRQGGRNQVCFVKQLTTTVNS
ncbi:MAG: SpoIIE family protein phosphatase [Desulfuromonas thiophila]|nr:SpoIIE family protein phosphatase [Desulfuromonas thiophila]